jgi:predicted RecB family nuclease
MQKRDDGTYLFSPTDLVNFLGCCHCTVLDLRAFSEPLKRDEESESERLLRRRGQEHEAAYLQSLKDAGKTVTEIPKDASIADRSRMTRGAMRKGADVIYQAALLGENWGGYADFLIKTASPSDLGPFSYEATDTKLARHPRVKDLIQLGVYSSLLASRQGVSPEQSRLILGDGSVADFTFNDFASYVRHAMQRLEHFAASPPPDSYPEPCSHCSICHWKETCAAQWQQDDHLSLVANIRRTQSAKLERAGIQTVAQLAGLAADTRIPTTTGASRSPGAQTPDR